MNTRFNRIKILTLITFMAIGIIFLLANCKRMQTKTTDIYVAVDGKDTNPGTKKAPFATFARARDMVRQKVRDGLTRDLQVIIHEGVYPQTEPLVFGPEDSGSSEYSITYAAYPGEKVILSGGQRITGWKKGTTAIWTTEIPEVKEGKWYFRQLFVNGKRTIRARTPNLNDQMPWWKIRTSTVSLKGILPGNKEVQPPEDLPITISVTGKISAYKNPGDAELVFIQNNAGSRKFLGTIDTTAQTFTLKPPHKWNPMAFGTEWKLSIPIEGTACYLENALEMLDQPGEWYLDRQTGLLSYWPLPDEDLNKAEVIAPVVQYTLLSITGTPEKPVQNLHFKGINVEYAEWPLPVWGYAGMFCCNVAVGKDPRPGHKFIEGAVEYSYARSCNFTDGGIAHVGGMGLCLRNGTENNIIEGNEIWDIGGGGIGGGYPNVAYGYLYAAPPPGQNEYKGYRIANNYIHHCGMIDFGAVGILMMSSQECIVAHNLIHDIAYFGIGFAGSQDPKVPFAKNNIIEYNHIYNAMKVTVDGAGMYITFTQYDRGCLIRGNLVHDMIPNRASLRPVGPYSAAGIYLDGYSSGNQYENNLTFSTTGALFINGKGHDLLWLDNIFLKNGTPPQEYVEAVKDFAGLEPAYQRALLKKESSACSYYPLTKRDTAANLWTAYQYDRSQSGSGVIIIFRRSENGVETTRFKLHALDPKALYEFKTWIGKYDQKDQNLLSEIQILPEPGKLLNEDKTIMTGQQLMEDGVQVKMPDRPSVSWIVYQRTSDSR